MMRAFMAMIDIIRILVDQITKNVEGVLRHQVDVTAATERRLPNGEGDLMEPGHSATHVGYIMRNLRAKTR